MIVNKIYRYYLLEHENKNKYYKQRTKMNILKYRKEHNPRISFI
jgi:hypothetical protein